ncbi:Sodium/nucleoside cotransporter 1, partial [Stegodyphus mimosarum]
MYRKTSSPQTLRKFDYETSWKAPSTVSREGLTSNTDWNDDPSKPPPIIEDSLNNSKKVTYANNAFICDIDIPVKKLSSEENSDSLPYSPDNNEGGNAQTFGENFLRSIQQTVRSHAKDIKLFFKVALFLLYNVYFAFAIYSTWDEASSFCDGIKFLTVITAMVYFCAFYSYVFKSYVLKRLKPCLRPLVKLINKFFLFSWLPRVIWSALWGAVIIFLILDTYDDRYRLVSAAGITVFIFLGYVFSKHRRKIIWRHLLWGIFIQFCIGLLILRWNVGKDIFRCLGDKVKGFLDVTDKGSSFVFGYLVTGSLTDAALQ